MFMSILLRPPLNGDAVRIKTRTPSGSEDDVLMVALAAAVVAAAVVLVIVRNTASLG